jgi:hypothetical protein
MTDVPNCQVYVILKPDGGNPGQKFFYDLVSEIANGHWGAENGIFKWRAPPLVWIDGTRQVYWSTFDDPLVAA